VVVTATPYSVRSRTRAPTSGTARQPSYGADAPTPLRLALRPHQGEHHVVARAAWLTEARPGQESAAAAAAAAAAVAVPVQEGGQPFEQPLCWTDGVVYSGANLESVSGVGSAKDCQMRCKGHNMMLGAGAQAAGGPSEVRRPPRPVRLLHDAARQRGVLSTACYISA
jgi:hypothetical protein